MHTLNLAQIEEIAAGSREKWWFKPPSPEDTRRILQIARELDVDALEKLYLMSQDPANMRLNNRLHVLLSAVARRYQAAHGLEM